MVGAGPAGSTTAGLLAGLGWSVHVLERSRFPRAKACGECLNPGAVATLERLGLLDVVLHAGPAVLDGWEIRTESGATARGFFGPAAGPALALPRDRLDQALLDRARSRGIVVEEGVRVESVRPGGRGLLPSADVREESGGLRTRRARVIVGADGLRSRVARSLGVVRRSPRLRKLSFTARVRGRGPAAGKGVLVLGDARTVGLAPVEAGPRPSLWNATVVVRAPAAGGPRTGDPASLVRSALLDAIPDWTRGPDIVDGPWASGPFDWPMRRVTAPGVLLVGDAAGYFDPLTGQGIYRALTTAEWAAEAIDGALRQNRVSSVDMRPYGSRLRRELRWSRAVQWAVEGVVSRAPLRDAAIGRLARAPAALDALLRVTGDARPAWTLLHPRSWLPLLRRPLPGTTMEIAIADRR
ncbi:MAG TPA: NAD(P)/FAD-dependent oxidoreductase [Longimicrobiales bacterium]